MDQFPSSEVAEQVVYWILKVEQTRKVKAIPVIGREDP
jgi:hypothetical protein